jgi:hypothetical protein
MSDDPVNGIQLLLNDYESIEKRLENGKKVSKAELDKLGMKSQKYILESLVPLRRDVYTLKKNDWVGWILGHQKLSVVIFIFYNSFLISTIREPVIEWIGGVLGEIAGLLKLF